MLPPCVDCGATGPIMVSEGGWRCLPCYQASGRCPPPPLTARTASAAPSDVPARRGPEFWWHDPYERDHLRKGWLTWA